MKFNLSATLEESIDEDVLSSAIDSLVIEQTRISEPAEIVSMILEETQVTDPGPRSQIRSFRNPDDLTRMIELMKENTCYDPLQSTTSTAEYSQLVKLALALILKGMTNESLAEAILEAHSEVNDPSVRTKNLRKLYSK
jgi:hypothetical protein